MLRTYQTAEHTPIIISACYIYCHTHAYGICACAIFTNWQKAPRVLHFSAFHCFIICVDFVKGSCTWEHEAGWCECLFMDLPVELYICSFT